MHPTLWLLLGLLFLSAFFSALETAYTSLDIIQIREIRKRHPRRASLVERLYRSPDVIITTLLIGNNLVNTAISVVTSEFVFVTFGNQNLAVITGLITIVILVFGEVTPKQLAIVYNRFLVENTAPLIVALTWIFRPFSFLLNLFARLIKAITGRKNTAKSLTAEGLLHMIEHAEDMGILDNASTRMMRGVFRFSDTTIHHIMTHRTKVMSLPQKLTVGEVLANMEDIAYSRIPVFHDNPETITGIVLEREIMRQHRMGNDHLPLKSLMIPPLFVPESWTTEKTFARLRSNRTHMAIVLDEYGGLAGIVTISDVIEDILGELPDDSMPPDAGNDRLRPCGENDTWRVNGELPVYQLLEGIGLELEVENPNATVAGYLEELTGRIPVPGETIRTRLGLFVVEESSRTVLKTLRLVLRSPDSPVEDMEEYSSD